MQDSSIQNARIHAETTVNDVDFRSVAFDLNLQCRAGPCDRIRFKPIRYYASAPANTGSSILAESRSGSPSPSPGGTGQM